MQAEYQINDESLILSIVNDPQSGFKPFDLEERIVNFAVEVTKVVDSLPENKVCSHLGAQLLRSGTSPAFNYGEAQGAESLKDFIHKFSICLKELREPKNNLTIIQRRGYVKEDKLVETVLDEIEQLIKIFKASIRTAQARSK